MSGLSPDSLLRVLSSSRSAIQQAATPSNALVEKRRVFLTEGMAKPPVAGRAIEGDVPRTADFYREGKPGTQPGVQYDIMPRALQDFDEEPASIRVLGKVTKKSKTEDKDLIPSYTKFILESVQESHSERTQIVETFGDFYAFFFGERPATYVFTGTLINSKNVNWLADFMFMYENFLRGTRCAENNARVFLTYGGRQVEGFILNVTTATNAANHFGVQVSFQVLILDRKFLQLSADFGSVIQNGQLVDDEGFLDLLSETGLSRAEVSDAFLEVKSVLDGRSPASGLITGIGQLLA